jgi:hypothetical protein
MILTNQFNMIAKCIMSSQNQLHLETCRKMIEERIEIWGDWISASDLKNLIGVRENELVDIQCEANLQFLREAGIDPDSLAGEDKEAPL